MSQNKMADKIRKVSDKVWAKLREIVEDLTTKTGSFGRPVRTSDIIEATTLSAAVFPLSLGAVQNAIFRPLRLTSNTRILGPIFGSLSVALSGCVVSVVFVLYVNVSRNIIDRAFESHKHKLDSLLSPIAFNFKTSDIVLYSIGSAVVFKLFGGRFTSVLPSSLVHPGAFARASLPTYGQSYASDIAKAKLNKLGRKYGCHSCGKKRWMSFVGDHIPPNKLVKPGQKQQFFPQCNKCSNLQGAVLSHNLRRKLIKTHATTLRFYHLWLPTPAAIMWLKTSFTDKHPH